MHNSQDKSMQEERFLWNKDVRRGVMCACPFKQPRGRCGGYFLSAVKYGQTVITCIVNTVHINHGCCCAPSFTVCSSHLLVKTTWILPVWISHYFCTAICKRISPLKYYFQSSVFTSHSHPAVTLSDPIYKYMIVSYFERGSACAFSFVARR